MFYGGAGPEDEAVVKVGALTALLGVDPDQSQVVPHHLQHVVQVQLHVTTRTPHVGGKCRSDKGALG